jgi:small-conductance mechanosensitive channel
VGRNVELEEGAYRANKLINYLTTGIFLITVAFIWIEAFDDLPTYLGLVSAGVAIALADVLKDMAGWIYILSRRPFQVGDRIEATSSKATSSTSDCSGSR